MAGVTDIILVDFSATSSPKELAPPIRGRHYRHVNAEEKKQIGTSISGGDSHGSASKIFGVSMGTISEIMHGSEDELASETHWVGGGKFLWKSLQK